MSEKFENLLKQANSRLKAGRIPLRIRARGSKLWLRGTLPPKPGSSKTKAYQQGFRTGIPFNPVGIKRAEDKAKALGGKLALGQFDWAEIDSKLQDSGTCLSWVRKFEASYWASKAETRSSLSTWKVYQGVFKKLPEAEPLTLEVLSKVALTQSADSRGRQKHCMILAKLAEFAGIDPEPIKAMRGNYGPSSVVPRSLPSNAQIIKTWESITHPGWRWVYGMMAAYGLRNHEVFGLDLEEFPKIYTHPKSKTGRRFVLPVPKSWVNVFELHDPALPELSAIKEPFDFSRLGTKVSVYFQKSKHITFNPYSLRHSYARNCFESGLDADLSAVMMGHSLKLHRQTYRAFWDEESFTQRYNKILGD